MDLLGKRKLPNHLPPISREHYFYPSIPLNSFSKTYIFPPGMDVLGKRSEYVGKRLVALPDPDEEEKSYRKSDLSCPKWLRQHFRSAIIRETEEIDKIETEFVVSLILIFNGM